MPNEPQDPKLADEAHRIATDAVDAVEDLAKAAIHLPAEAARLTLTALRKSVAKLEDVVNSITSKE